MYLRGAAMEAAPRKPETKGHKMKTQMDALKMMERLTANQVGDQSIEFMLGRAPMFGDDDLCIIVSGSKAVQAANLLAAGINGAKVQRMDGERLDGLKYTYATVTAVIA